MKVCTNFSLTSDLLDVTPLYDTNIERKKRESIPSLHDEDELPWAMYNKMKTRNEEENEKENESELENENDSEDNDEKYGNFFDFL